MCRCADRGRDRPGGVRRTRPEPDQAAGGAEKLRQQEHPRSSRACCRTRPRRSTTSGCTACGMGRPFVTWKFATTLDGRSRGAGRDQPVDHRADRARRRAPAPGRVRRDRGRHPDRAGRRPRADGPRRERRTGSRGSRCGSSSAIARSQPTARVRNDRAETLLLPTHDPAEVLRQLDDRQIRHLWLEGGPTLAAAFLRAGLVDQIVAYVAPAVLGSGFAAIGDLGAESIDHLRRFKLADVTRLGDDVRLTLTLARSAKDSLNVHRNRRRARHASRLSTCSTATPPGSPIRGPKVTEDAGHGDSIAVNGCCLTVVETGDGTFTADVMRETLQRTSLGALSQGRRRSTSSARSPRTPGSAATSSRATSTASARSRAGRRASTGRSSGSRRPRTSSGTSPRRARSPSTGSR